MEQPTEIVSWLQEWKWGEKQERARGVALPLPNVKQDSLKPTICLGSIENMAGLWVTLLTMLLQSLLNMLGDLALLYKQHGIFCNMFRSLKEEIPNEPNV